MKVILIYIIFLFSLSFITDLRLVSLQLIPIDLLKIY